MPCPALLHFLCFVFFVKEKLSISKIDKLFLKQVAFLLLRISLILKYGAIHIIRDPFCTFSYLLHNLIFLNHCISLWTANFASKSIKIRVLKANKKFRWHFADPPRMSRIIMNWNFNAKLDIKTSQVLWSLLYQHKQNHIQKIYNRNKQL
jgi:hypothetical protein